MSMEEVQSTLLQAGEQLSEGSVSARDAWRAVHNTRAIVAAADRGLDKADLWLVTLETVQGHIGTIVHTGSSKLMAVDEKFTAVADDSKNPTVQTVRQQTDIAQGHLDGYTQVAGANIPETLLAVKEDIDFIREHLAAIRTLGAEMLGILSVAERTLQVVSLSAQNAALATRDYLIDIS